MSRQQCIRNIYLYKYYFDTKEIQFHRAGVPGTRPQQSKFVKFENVAVLFFRIKIYRLSERKKQGDATSEHQIRLNMHKSR